MLLHEESRGGGTLLAVHITDFNSTLAAWRWRRAARRRLPEAPGLVFAKAMPFVGSGASAGFGGGVPALRCQVLLTAWRAEADLERFLDTRLPLRVYAVVESRFGRRRFGYRYLLAGQQARRRQRRPHERAPPRACRLPAER